MIETTKFARKPFFVDAVQVTAENMEQVAQWCKGDVRTEGSGEEVKYVKVRVNRPLTDRQTKAYVGDWVLSAGSGYKVYTDKAFAKSFESVFFPQPEPLSAEDEKAQKVIEHGERVELPADAHLG